MSNVLENDLTTVDPSYPVLPAGSYVMKVSDIKVEKAKDGVGDNLVIKLSLDQQAKDDRGRQVFPGHIITDRISLATTAKYSEESIQKRLKAFQLAHFKESECPAKFAPIDQYIGKQLTVKLRIEEDSTGQYDPSNRIAKYVPKD